MDETWFYCGGAERMNLPQFWKEKIANEKATRNLNRVGERKETQLTNGSRQKASIVSRRKDRFQTKLANNSEDKIERMSVKDGKTMMKEYK